MVDGGTLEDFTLSVCSHEEELIVWREGDSCDRISEVKVGNDNVLDHVDNQGKAVYINAD